MLQSVSLYSIYPTCRTPLATLQLTQATFRWCSAILMAVWLKWSRRCACGLVGKPRVLAFEQDNNCSSSPVVTGDTAERIVPHHMNIKCKVVNMGTLHWLMVLGN